MVALAEVVEAVLLLTELLAMVVTALSFFITKEQ